MTFLTWYMAGKKRMQSLVVTVKVAKTGIFMCFVILSFLRWNKKILRKFVSALQKLNKNNLEIM